MDERDPIDVHVGQIIRRGRLERGLSLERLALDLGVTYQQIQKYETGANRVSASTLYRTAVALDMPIAAFFPVSNENSVSSPIGSTDDVRACRALERIEDGRIRAGLRKLIGALADDLMKPRQR